MWNMTMWLCGMLRENSAVKIGKIVVNQNRESRSGHITLVDKGGVYGKLITKDCEHFNPQKN